MQLGISVPNMGPLTSPEILVDVAQRAERFGYSDVWVGDHIVYPVEIRSEYPFPGGFSGKADPNVIEPLLAMAYIGAMTSRVRIGVSVVIVPLRNPVAAAKMVTTLDVLTGGRVIYGIGVGWMREEFEALGADFSKRGPVTDEYIRIYKDLCTTEVSTFEGRFYSYRDVLLAPKPVQKPHPPIWVGGNTPAALARAARLGDGWQPANLTWREVKEGSGKLRELMEQEGRDPGGIVVSVRLVCAMSGGRPMPEGVGCLYGSAREILDSIKRYEEAGVGHILVTPRGATREEVVGMVERIGIEVVPRV